jgi:hypothetical protein
MNDLPKFHDGYLDGVLTSEDKTARFFLRTMDGKLYTLVLRGLELMTVKNFKQGNIIFDLLFFTAEQLTVERIAEIYEVEPNSAMAQKMFLHARSKCLQALEMSSSYGAECVALFNASEIIAGHSS